MVLKFNEMKETHLEAPRGGKGTGMSRACSILQGLEGKVKMFNYMHLDEGSAIGYHQHVEDLEIYILTSGKAIYNDNGKEVEVSAGDAMLCNKGEHHSLAAKGGAIDFIAIIIG